MTHGLAPDNPELRAGMDKLYREFFTKAEKRRRWSLDDDIDWTRTNKSLPPELADVVETFCAVELYLPDYISQALPMIRENRGWAWTHLNWGYEEAKHSMALGDWLLKSGHRTEEQMTDMEGLLFDEVWNPPIDNGPGMLIYAMTQELATWVHYRNLQEHVKKYGDGTLERVLQLVAIDERAHHAFYKRVVGLFLELDRQHTLEQLKRVIHDFAMPAVHMLAQSKQRESTIRSLCIFDEQIFYSDVYMPILQDLGVTRKEMKRVGTTRKA